MRKPLQEITDMDIIRNFMAKNRYCFLSVIDGDEPYTVPLNYGHKIDEDGTMTLFFHTSVGGRLYDIIQREGCQNIKVAFSLAEMKGLLKSIKGVCDWDIDYKSVMGSGSLNMLTEVKDKDDALRILMHCFGAEPGFKFVPAILAAVIVYEVKVKEYHMKKSKQEIAE